MLSFLHPHCQVNSHTFTLLKKPFFTRIETESNPILRPPYRILIDKELQPHDEGEWDPAPHQRVRADGAREAPTGGEERPGFLHHAQHQQANGQREGQAVSRLHRRW